MPKWIAGIVATFWVLFFGIDYLWHHPYYLRALDQFPYTSSLMAILGVAIAIAVAHHLKKGTWMPFATKNWNGLTLWGFLMLTEVILFAGYAIHSQALSGTWMDSMPSLLVSIISAHVFLGLVTLLALGLGGYVLQWLGLQYDSRVQPWIQMGTGFGVLSLLLFGLATLGLLSGWLPWLLFVVLVLPNYKLLGRTMHSALWKRPGSFSVHPLTLLPFAAAVLLIGANLLGMNRPVPVGFDAVNFYLNIPNLLGQSGQLISGGQPYNWSLIMSLGFVGWESTRLALLLSILPGILSVWVLYRLSRLYLSVGYSVLTAVLFYALPMVTWQSTQEAKVDLGLTFILLVALLAFLSPLTSSGKKYSQIILVGFLLGIAVGIKFTALFAILGVGVAWLYQQRGTRIGVAGALLSVGSLFAFGLYRFAPIPLQLGGSLLLGGALLAGGLVLLYLENRKASLRDTILPLLVLGGSIILTFSPWLVKNAIETQQIGFKELITGKPLYPELPALQELDLSDPQSQNLYWLGKPLYAQQGALDLSRTSQEELRKNTQMESGVYEEVARYMGYENTLPRYLTLPYDMTMRANVSNYVVDSGAWLWLLLPLLLLGTIKRRGPTILAAGMLLLFGALSVYGGWGAFGVSSWADAAQILEQGEQELVLAGLFVPLNQLLFMVGSSLSAVLGGVGSTVLAFFVFLLLFAIGLTAGYQQRQWVAGQISLVFVFAVVYLLVWWLLGSGIPWYGQLGFAIGPLVLLYWIHFQQQQFLYLHYLGLSVLGLLLFFSVIQRWHTPDPLNASNQQFLVPLFAQYTAGEKTADEVYLTASGKYDPALAVINAENQGKLLRFGTFINYYIQNNTERIYLDNQLNNFKYLYDYVEGDSEKLFNLFEALDIRYIVMSLNVGDDTEEQLLGQKAELVMGFIRDLFYRDTPLVRLIYTDQDAQQQQRGSYAAYELLFYE